MERAGGMERALGADKEVPPARELAAEEGEGGELVAGHGGEREREMEEGEAVGEALMEGGDHVSLLRVDVFETADADAQADEAGGEPGPPALGGPAGRPAADARRAPIRQTLRPGERTSLAGPKRMRVAAQALSQSRVEPVAR